MSDTLTGNEPITEPIEIPRQICDAVAAGKCVLFLGAMVSASSPDASPYRYLDAERPPGGASLSRHLATLCRYSESDTENLAKVALFYEYTPGFGRADLANTIREQVAGRNIRIS